MHLFNIQPTKLNNKRVHSIGVHPKDKNYGQTHRQKSVNKNHALESQYQAYGDMGVTPENKQNFHSKISMTDRTNTKKYDSSQTTLSTNIYHGANITDSIGNFRNHFFWDFVKLIRS